MEDWRGDAASMLEYQSIKDEAKESAEALDDLDEDIDLNFKKRHAPKLRDLVSFYMWSHMMVMETARLLIERELIDDAYNQEQVREFLREEHVSDKFLLDLIKEAGVIDDLHSELNRIRRIRNEMAHSSRRRALLESEHLDEDNLATEVDRAYRAYEEAQDLLE